MIAALTLADRADVLRGEDDCPRTLALREEAAALPRPQAHRSSGMTTLQALPVPIATCCRDVGSDDEAPALREAH
ncbi:hypothetical protein [Cupriavidus necator]|uniref:hypothetical protein n=1 Tax=Cupriavidus necator TaxID=106590 RepID=UPI0005B498E0|nr:hypothetical protein [Cupriavidus necator]